MAVILIAQYIDLRKLRSVFNKPNSNMPDQNPPALHPEVFQINRSTEYTHTLARALAAAHASFAENAVAVILALAQRTLLFIRKRKNTLTLTRATTRVLGLAAIALNKEQITSHIYAIGMLVAGGATQVAGSNYMG